jgi:hypothetical protein
MSQPKDFRTLAGCECANKIPWWEKKEPRRPLPEDLQKMLEANDPRFIEELQKFAYRFSRQSYYDEEQNRYIWVDWNEYRKRDGSWLWTMYCLDHPLARKGLIELLSFRTKESMKNILNLTYSWGLDYTFQVKKKYTFVPTRDPAFYRYLKGMFKSAEKNRDLEIWKLLAYRFDVEIGESSMWNGPSERYYKPNTRHYLRRRAWRFLRHLGQQASSDYVKYATELLLLYQGNENGIRKRYFPEHNRSIYLEPFQSYWIFNHILYHNSPRMRCVGSESWKILDPNVYKSALLDVREEAFPELWDQAPEMLLRLLHEGKVNPVIHFASRALKQGNPQFIEKLSNEQLYVWLKDLLSARREFAAEVLLSRLDAKNPEFEIWFSFATNPDLGIREKAKEFVEKNAANWSRESLRYWVEQFLIKIQQENSLPSGVIQDFVYLLQTAFQPVLELYASIDLIQKVADTEYPVLQELAVTLLENLDPDQHPFTGHDLLPLLVHKNQAIREEARLLLNKHFVKLQLDVDFLVQLATIPGEENQVFATQFFADRILWLVPFLPELIRRLWAKMISSETPEEVRDYLIRDLMGSLFFHELLDTPLEKVVQLMNSDKTDLQDFGARLLRAINPDPKQLTFDQLLMMAHCQIAAAREHAREMIIKVRERITSDWLINLAETDWDDTREWALKYIETLSSGEIDPELIFGLLDTARKDIQSFAMRLVNTHRYRLDPHELMLRAAESPYLHVQEYALEIAEQIEWDAETFDRLELFFRTILFRVNQGRKEKNRALRLLLHLAEHGDQALAERIGKLLSDVARNGGKRDFELILMTLTRLQTRYPEIQTPLMVK